MRGMLWPPALAAFVITFACVRVLVSDFGRHLVLDRPNERSLHAYPVPRTGGLAIIAGIAAGCLVGQPGFSVTLGVAAVLAVVSFLDDVLGLRTLVRLVSHLAAVSAILLIDLRFPGWILFVVLTLSIAWYANLYNFMDGSDGLAGGMSVIGFGAYALTADGALAVFSATIAAAAAAFLILNFHPARIFMGDVGSIPLGFLAGALGVVGWRDGFWPLWFPLLVFAPFVCDASLTLLKRMFRRERLWQAHRDHYYQRLVRMGLGHRGTAYIEYAAMVGCAAAAIIAHDRSPAEQFGVILGSVVVLLAIAGFIDFRWAKYVRASRRAV